MDAHLGRVDAERRPAGRASRRSSAPRARRSSARRGSSGPSSARSARWCRRSMREREADGGQRAAEAPEQLVVAAAAAERRRRAPGRAPRTPRPCSSRGRATRPRSKIDALGHVGREPLETPRRPSTRVADGRRSPRAPRGRRAAARRAAAGSRRASSRRSTLSLALQPHEVAAWPARAARARGRRPSTPAWSSSAGYSAASPSPMRKLPQPGRLERAAQHGQRLGGAVRRREADELDAGLQELARLPAVRAHRRGRRARRSRSAAAARTSA